MVAEAGFRAGGVQHLSALAVTAFVVFAMCRVALWGRFGGLERVQRFGLAILMLMIFPLSLVAAKGLGIPLTVGNSLPMHLCDWAAVTAFMALIWRRPLLCELTYFWGLAGTLQGLITPDLAVGFPHPGFLIFFLHHGGVVLAAIYVSVGLRMIPRRGSVWRVFLWTQFYVVAAMVANLIFGTNYGYLRAKPASASLLDYMGSWPYYILALEVLCILIFLVLDAPFAMVRRRREKRMKEPGARSQGRGDGGFRDGGSP